MLFEKSDQYGKSEERAISSSRVNTLAILGSIASIVGLILAIVFRIQDKRNHKTKESNRPAEE